MGATGTVGREVCAALLERGAEVRVGARASSEVTSILPDVSDVRSELHAWHREIDAAVDPALPRIVGRPATSLSEFVERNRAAWQ